MSWSDYLFDSEHKQRRDLLSQGEEICSLYSRNAELERRIEALNHENGEIKLFCVTLLRILVDREIVSQEAFVELSRQIDAESGYSDGKYEGRILPQIDPPSKPDIKIDFSSAKQKPKSFNP